MALTQDYVNQLVREAAAQAGGTLSYEDAVRAATNLGIPSSLLQDSIASGLITAAPTTTTTSDAPTLFGNLANVATNWGGGNTPIPLNDPIVHIANQILSQGLTSKWTGEGAGSPEANALYMADTLRKAGITDISQFGEIKQTVQGEPIYGEDGYIIGYGPDKVITTYGNKETGQVLPNTYGERQTGNAWGGTYAGEGNTAYRVQFDASGNPIFYTTGASSSDVGDLAPLLVIGSLAVAPWLSTQIGALTGLTGAGLSAATGATLGAGSAALTGGDILKGALLGGAASYATGSIGGGDVGITDRQFAIADAKQLADAGLNSAQIADVLSSAGFNDAIISRAIGSIGAVPADSVLVTAPRIQQPVGVAPGLLGASIGAQSITPSQLMPPSGQTVEIVGERPRDTAILPGVGISTTPITSDQVVEIVGERPRDTLVPPSTITEPVIPTPIIPTPIDIPKIQAPKDVTVKDVINTIGAVGTVAGLVDAATAGDKGFDIVDVPSEWRTPTYGVPGDSAWPRLTPIDFGSRELLRGTQWENFINQPVAQIPVVQPQQTGMSYADLVNALQGNQGPRLTIGDIISGIQGQYGQINPGSMG